jgi:GTP-binding protein
MYDDINTGNMNKLSVKFKTGVVGESEIMYDGTPHIAFIGRSNVGKSTTINSLLGRKKLVKTGNTPGKTREINFFEVINGEEKVYFVDLPGYGYAKVSKNERERLQKMIEWYVSHPASDLALIVLIIDARAGLTDFDKQMIDLMVESKREFILAVNKIDKLNQKTIHKLKNEIKEEIPNAETGKNIFYYSALKNKHIHILRDILLKEID